MSIYLALLLFVSLTQGEENMRWYCFLGSSFKGNVNVWWGGNDPGSGSWACNSWISACGNGGGCTVKAGWICHLNVNNKAVGIVGTSSGHTIEDAQSACNQQIGKCNGNCKAVRTNSLSALPVNIYTYSADLWADNLVPYVIDTTSFSKNGILLYSIYRVLFEMVLKNFLKRFR
jgi:hypothetical protein